MNEIARTTKNNGKILIQMPAKYGIRSIQQQFRRGFSEGKEFDIRYWSPAELTENFEKIFGQTKLFTDCYFGLGVQKTDIDLIYAVENDRTVWQISNTVSPFSKVIEQPQ